MAAWGAGTSVALAGGGGWPAAAGRPGGAGAETLRCNLVGLLRAGRRADGAAAGSLAPTPAGRAAGWALRTPGGGTGGVRMEAGGGRPGRAVSPNLEERWSRRLAELEAFREEHGHCNVPQTLPENPALGRWVDTQRRACKGGELGKEREAMLDALGFEWERRVEWEERFGELGAFKEEHGHCSVPQGWEENPALGFWVKKQRWARKRGNLGEEREARLDAVGFEWELRVQVEWAERFGELEAFREGHGHCNVPQKWPENPALAKWVKTQRVLRKTNGLDEGQVERLGALGFEWALRDLVPPWERRYRELKRFRERFGHCDVPEGWEENPVLAKWVGMQRKNRRTKALVLRRDDRRGRLEALGFSWEGYESGRGARRPPDSEAS